MAARSPPDPRARLAGLMRRPAPAVDAGFGPPL